MRNKFYLRGIAKTFIFLTLSTAAYGNDLLNSAYDTLLTTKIKSALLAHPVTKSTHIHVETHQGNVLLSGVVDSQTEANTAKDVAKHTSGVRNVYTKDLMVKHSRQPTIDSYIISEVKHRLAKENLLSNRKYPSLRIIVEAKNSNIYLSGTIIYPEQGQRAIAIASASEGVKKVYYDFKLKKL